MGCGGSKATAAGAPAAKPQEAGLLTPAPETKPEEVQAPAPPALKLTIASVHGLRPADVLGNKSEVFVEVVIEGKPESKVTTAVVSGKAEKAPGAEEGAKACIAVEFKFEAELKGYVSGDKVVFTVKDKDYLMSDVMGKATVADGSFGGKLVLEGAGEGYDAFLMVQLGEGGGLAELQEIGEKTRQKLAEAMDLAATGNPMKVLEAADMASDAIVQAAVDTKDTMAVAIEEVIESKGAVCCSC